MGRRNPLLWRQQSYIRLEENSEPGCIWGILRLLNYHRHWKYVKKMLPHKKHATKNRDVGKKKAENRLIGVNEADALEPGTVSKRSFKARLRDLMAKENSKSRVLDLPEPPQSSNLVVENPNHGGNVDSLSKEKLGEEDVDILEIFKVNKQIFLKMLNDHDLTRVKQSMKPDMLPRLAKSGSFPAMRDWAPCKLQDKQREIWPPFKGRDSDPSAKSMPLLHDLTVSMGRLRSMRRASSLTESTDRYAQLYNSTFSKDFKRDLYRSFKMVTENEEPTPKFRRRLSLPECGYDSFVANLEASGKAVDRIKDSANLDVNTAGTSFETAGEACEDVVNEEIISHLEQVKDDVDLVMDPDAQQRQFLCKGDQMSTTESTISEGLPSNSTCKVELVDENHNPAFHYMKHVLEVSGFSAENQTWIWYTIDQPLNPTLFEEIELQFNPFEQLRCSTKTEENRWDRKLIFDLINEALVEIDERSCLYYPRALSLSCQVHRIPKGKRLLEEVWVFVERCLSWRPELDPTLDSAVARDLYGRHGWMNLQIENECVGLELEDMILDELLLDEILRALS